MWLRHAARALPLLLAFPLIADADTHRRYEQDNRLASAVSFDRPRVYLGELVADLSAAAHVPLSVSDVHDPASGIQLSAFVRNRPARDVMSALAELLGTHERRWDWNRAESGSGYTLVHYPSIEGSARAARRRLLDAWTADLKTMHEICRLPEAERAARAKEHNDLFPGGDVREGRSDIFARLQPEQLQQLLAGNFVPLSGAALTPREREGLRFGMDLPPLRDGEKRARQGFFIEWNERNLGPVLRLQNERAMAINVLGSTVWDRKWLDASEPGWRNAGDPDVYAFHKREVEHDPSAGAPLPEQSLFAWIKRAAAVYPESVIVDPVVSRMAEVDGAAWLAKDWPHTVFALLRGTNLVTREHRNITLLRHVTAAIHSRRHLVPWPVIRQLRQQAERDGGYLSLNERIQLTAMSPEQLEGLAEEFPDASLGGSLAVWRPILLFYQHLEKGAQKTVTTAGGLPLRDAGIVAKAALMDAPEPASRGLTLSDEEMRHASVSFRVEERRIQERSFGKEPVTRDTPALIWEVRVSDKPRFRTDLPLRPRRPLEPTSM